MRKLVVLVITVFIVFVFSNVNAEEKTIPKEAFDELAVELSKLHKEVMAIQQTYFMKGMVAYGQYQPDYRFVLTKNTKIYSGAATFADPLYEKSHGAIFNVVDKMPGWYAVELGESVHGISVGWVQAGTGVPEIIAAVETSKQNVGGAYEALTLAAKKFRDKFQNNPHIRVTGFSINISMSPGLSLDFEFKKNT